MRFLQCGTFLPREVRVWRLFLNIFYGGPGTDKENGLVPSWQALNEVPNVFKRNIISNVTRPSAAEPRGFLAVVVSVATAVSSCPTYVQSGLGRECMLGNPRS